MNNIQQCHFDDCTNDVFLHYDQCVLHCEKNDYNKNRRGDFLSEFNKKLKEYIFLQTPKCKMFSKINSDTDKFRDHVATNAVNVSDVHFTAINQKGPHIEDIIFPSTHVKDDHNYEEILKIFKSISFKNCTFNSGYINFNNTKVHYDNCIFKTTYNIDAISTPSEQFNFMYLSCVFEKNVNIKKTDDFDTINENLFNDCIFKGNINIQNLKIHAKIFKFKQKLDKENTNYINKLIIINCTFRKSIKLNYITLNELNISNTKFNSKFEIKFSTVQIFNFIDSNVKKIFDSFSSKFIQARFEKSIFQDFAGFEKVHFGKENSSNNNYKTIFQYVTFKNFSNFRKSYFYSGLDIENINLKEPPNFLHTTVSQKNTTRETFRIIKNSFDVVGNKIEANNFFIQEMQAYKKELKKQSFWTQDRFVYILNDAISNFGNSYIKPILLFILMGIIYSTIVYIHINYRDYPLISILYSDCFSAINEFSASIYPFSKERLIKGMETISVLYQIIASIFIWQIIIAVKRRTQR